MISTPKRMYRIELFDVFLKLICIFPVFTMLIADGIHNKILVGVVLCLITFFFFRKGMKYKTFAVVFVIILLYVYTILQTTFPLDSVNLLFYYPFAILYMCVVENYNKEILSWAQRNQRYMTAIVNIWTVLVGVSVFLPSSYYIKEGGTVFFGSYCGSIFRLGPTAFFIQALSLLLYAITKRKRFFWYMLLPMFCYFAGSSRTYLAIGGCLFAVCWYWQCGNKKIFWLTAIPIAAAFLIMIMNSQIGDKILYTLDSEQYGDFWYRVTSSRSAIWEADIEAWKDQPVLNKLFGSGIGFTFEVYGKWSHNDFIEILCSFGIVGLIVYVVVMAQFLRKMYRKRKIPAVVTWATFLAWLLNAFLNMHYVYFCCLLSFPLVVIAEAYFYAPKNYDSQVRAVGQCH